MFDPRLYFDLALNPKNHKVVLIEKSDKSEFSFRKFGSKFLRWKCTYHTSGCDAFFKTNVLMTEFRGFPHLIHSNHEGIRPQMLPIP